MSHRHFVRACVIATGLSAAMAGALFAFAGPAAPAAAATSGACPSASALQNFKTAGNVSANFVTSGLTSTYFFSSLTDQSPVAGVPGLIKYCVYSSPGQRPVIHVDATGADGAAWIFRSGPRIFSFDRPSGNPSNIPLDGMTTQMGTATWSGEVPAQQILLHINDRAECVSLYRHSTDTCFVKPSPPVSDCDHGDNSVAYNALSFGAVNCVLFSLGFEAQATNEFGDEVGLASTGPGAGRELVSLNVLLSSFACQEGHWNTGDCVSNPGATFQVPITATIYTADDSTSPPSVGTKIASVMVTQTLPYRPSADPVKCTGPDAGKWFNPQVPPSGACKNALSTVLTFDFPAGIKLPEHVIWTVAFNTTHFGYTPAGQNEPCFGSSGGCPYDSLNVGTTSFPGAPYAGTDLNEDLAFQSVTTGGMPGPLQAVSGFTGLRPLGEIITR